ncbi:heterokaryon incompatibility protein-domain-containing protein [Paraphoma chrysanthemicola]|nr:heterokaryon incompatibility protein-domain-containing protein [Paraphoma chrysanthemicola]
MPQPRLRAEVDEYVRKLVSQTGWPSRITNPNLCRKCQAMFSARGLFYLFARPEGLRGDAAGGGFKHSRIMTFKIRKHCHFCRFIWLEDLNGDSNHPQTTPRLSEYAESKRCRQPHQTWIYFRAFVMDDRRWGHMEFRAQSAKGRLLWQPAFPLSTTVVENSIFASHLAYRPFQWTGLTDHSGLALHALLKHCEEHHRDCQPSGSRPLPSRLVKLVNGGEKVQLYVSEPNQQGRYAALSYCWGGLQELRLLRTNMQSFQSSPIATAQLPETLRDTIALCRRLKLGFVWIDALCIVQDDEVDKKQEISRMCSIYENSSVTIVAATATSVAQGFLNHRVHVNKAHPSCTIDLTCSHEAACQERSLGFTAMHVHHMDNFPISQRGWTFQESYIPPRLMVFGDHEPFLRCRTSDATAIAQTAIQYSLSHILPRRNITYGRHYEFRSIWQNVVEDYTERQFSFEDDRPLAINGIVEFLEHRYGGKCYFGVWDSIPIGCLLWTVTSQKRASSRYIGLPTWSWLSTPNTVCLDVLELLGNYDGDAVIEFSERDPSHIIIECPVIVYDVVADFAIEYWQDHEDEDKADILTNTGVDYFLLLSRMTNDTVRGLSTVQLQGGKHMRRGVLEVRDAEKWLSKPKKRVILA